MEIANLLISHSYPTEAPLFQNNDYSINNNDIIIYTIYLPDLMYLKAHLVKFLSTSELDRAKRFHNEIDTNRFIIYRSILKLILAAYTKSEVENIQFKYNSNKKPTLSTHPKLNFNISHSEDYAIIAISGQKVGIDIEYKSKKFDFTDILSDVFGDDEIFMIENAINKKQAFYTYWTRKEALVKALGIGIDEDFKYIPCLDGHHSIDSALIKSTENWEVYSFNLADNYLSAVACEGGAIKNKNIIMYTIPNTMKEILDLMQIKIDC